jgi:hypothetical protein
MKLLENALAGVPVAFRSRLLKHYAEIKTRNAKARFDREYDSAGLSVGKFAEVVLRLLQEKLTSQHTAFGSSIGNFAGEVDKLAKVQSSQGTESERILIPRALLFLYTIRNKRDVGHVGGDVEANESDATTTAKLADWVVCELIRVYHGISLEEAQALVDSINSRSIPSVWEINGKKRVLAPGLKANQKVLVLAYTDIENGVLVEDMQAWVKYENTTNFRNQVLRPLDDQGLIEYDRDTQTIHLSPTGVEEVETRILRLN